MQLTRVIRRLRPRQLSLAGVTLTLVAIGACNDEAIVYPNRNQMAPAGGAMTAGGAAGEAGAPELGGTSGGGTGGSGNSAGSLISLGGNDGYVDDGGASGAGVAPPLDQCGDHLVQPPEECDDGNKISGDGCSAQCKSSCEVCEKNACPPHNTTDVADWYAQCYQLAGVAQTGAAAGVARKVLCQAAMDCVRAEKCAQLTPPGPDIRSCWCDVDWSGKVKATTLCSAELSNDPNNPSTFVKGKCYQEITDAAEATKNADVLGAFTATAKAFGAAYGLFMGCDRHICDEECMPGTYPKETIASISADISALPNAAGESQLGDLVADSQRMAAAADFVFVMPIEFAPDGDEETLHFTATPNRAADANGRVLRSEAYAAIEGYGGLSPNTNAPPHGALVVLTLTGKQIETALGEQFLVPVTRVSVSGLKYTWSAGKISDTGGSPVPSIVSVTKTDGSALDPMKTYSVAVVTFFTTPTTSSFPTLSNSSTPTRPVTGTIVDVFFNYLSNLTQPVAPPALDRITLQPPT